MSMREELQYHDDYINDELERVAVLWTRREVGDTEMAHAALIALLNQLDSYDTECVIELIEAAILAQQRAAKRVMAGQENQDKHAALKERMKLWGLDHVELKVDDGKMKEAYVNGGMARSFGGPRQPVPVAYRADDGLAGAWQAGWDAGLAEAKLAHATNIGLIMLALAHHEVGDYGDCSINHPILNIIDSEIPAHKLVEAFDRMTPETAAGIVGQLGPWALANAARANAGGASGEG